MWGFQVSKDEAELNFDLLIDQGLGPEGTRSPVNPSGLTQSKRQQFGGLGPVFHFDSHQMPVPGVPEQEVDFGAKMPAILKT